MPVLRHGGDELSGDTGRLLVAAGDDTRRGVGARPCTTDGVPLIGRTRSPRVYMSGGHGMWGIALGPLSGKLLADQMINGATHPLLEAFDPLR